MKLVQKFKGLSIATLFCGVLSVGCFLLDHTQHEAEMAKADYDIGSINGNISYSYYNRSSGQTKVMFDYNCNGSVITSGTSGPFVSYNAVFTLNNTYYISSTSYTNVYPSVNSFSSMQNFQYGNYPTNIKAQLLDVSTSDNRLFEYNLKVDWYINTNLLVSDNLHFYIQTPSTFNPTLFLMASGSWTYISNIELFSPSQTDDYMNGFDSGYNDGYTAGYNIGNNQGYNNGHQVGYDEGVASQQQAITDSYNAGYTDGYNQGSTQDETVATIFSGILQVAMVPVNFFLAIFNFEILGVNLSGFITALFTIALTIIVIRTIFGGKGGNGDS